MSAKVEALVAKYSKLVRANKAVLLAIARLADDDGKAFPAVPTIAQQSGLKKRAVQYSLNAAVKADELERIYNYGPHGVNVYRVKIEVLQRWALNGSTQGGGCTPCTGARGAHKGSSLKRVDSYSSLPSGSNSSLSSGSERFESSASVATPTTPAREPRPPAEPKDFQAQAEKNGYMSCPDCGAWLSRCHCGDDLNASFDAAMRDTLDAGKPGPAHVASEAALRKSHADWQPGKIRDVSQAEVDAGWDAVEQKLLAESAYQRMLAK